MHDIWNQWHGCRKYSEGCDHCYMYYLDSLRDVNSTLITKTNNFNYPLQKKRDGSFKVQAGELIQVCMTSDFFLEEADAWRENIWDIIRYRKDVKFYILTKRAERIKDHLPSDWEDGYDNVILNVTCENQRRADERIPILLSIPAKHKGIMCAPFIGHINIESVKDLHDSCFRHNITFNFIETGNTFVKDGKTFHISNKPLQAKQAYLSHLSFQGKPIQWNLYDTFNNPIPLKNLYKPHFRENCATCASRLICNGCSDCGKCKQKIIHIHQTDGF